MISSPYFNFNGKSCKDFLVCAMEMNIDILNPMDIPYSTSLTMEEGSNKFSPIFEEEDDVPEEITINLFFDTTSELLEWTDERFQQISDWLITDDFEPFQLDNSEYFYYFKCTGIQKQLNFRKRGYLEVTFQPLCQYAFKKVIIDKFVKGKEYITISNPSKWDYYPLIQVESLDGSNIHINDLIIVDIEPDEVFNIDCDMLICLNQENKNRITNINRKWIKLSKGDTQLVVEGNCHIRILCEFPVIA